MSRRQIRGLSRHQPKRPRFPKSLVAAIDASKMLGIRAGMRTDHRFIGIWPVVVDGRIFARSWTIKADGWYRTLLSDPVATIQVGARKVRVRAVPITSERIRDEVQEAYARKYTTPGSLKYVRGFRTERRRATTMEFVPR